MPTYTEIALAMVDKMETEWDSVANLEFLRLAVENAIRRAEENEKMEEAFMARVEYDSVTQNGFTPEGQAR